jgi:hypothetical protein
MTRNMNKKASQMYTWWNFTDGYHLTEALVEKGMIKTIAILKSRMPLDKR